MFRPSRRKPNRERQFQHSEALSKRGQYSLAYRLQRCANSAAEAERLGRMYPDYQCDSRYCEYCGGRKAARYRRTYGPVLEGIVYEGYSLSSLVLVANDVKKLERGRSDSLLRVFKHMQRIKPLKGKVIGAFVQYEVEHVGDWLPHLHAILVYEECPSWKDVQKVWYRLTGSSHIYIDKIDYEISDPQSVRDAIDAMINYVCKYTSFEVRAFDEMFEATRNMRLARAYGVLRKRKDVN